MTVRPPVPPLQLVALSLSTCIDRATDCCLAQAKESRIKEAAFRGGGGGGGGGEIACSAFPRVCEIKSRLGRHVSNRRVAQRVWGAMNILSEPIERVTFLRQMEPRPQGRPAGLNAKSASGTAAATAWG